MCSYVSHTLVGMGSNTFFVRMCLLFCIFLFIPFCQADAAYHFGDYRGQPPIHVEGSASSVPMGLAPATVKAMYHLPALGGTGTIAIIGAYNDASIESDLATFDMQFGIAPCTTKNGCFTRHLMSKSAKTNSDWALETTLDVEWAHAIAPNAKILLVEATTPSGANLIKAVDYASAQPNVVAISMSWGGAEFPEEISLDSHFVSKSGAVYIASSGDSGTGASWPASSPRVIGVGGSSVILDKSNNFVKEVAWAGSGGGISAYEQAPDYQTLYSISKSNGMRAIPDVAYNADPVSGFAIVRSGVWRRVGGTSAGAPQWAAIVALGSGVTVSNLYKDKSSQGMSTYFRDIVSGNNGTCGYLCTARSHYDYVTGLGTPVTVHF